MCERITHTAPCPGCGIDAHRIHSRYERTVWDLSVQNRQVILHLRVRKFYCDQPTCPRRIFAERLPQVTSPHGRYTLSLRQFLGPLGQEQGGAPGARSAKLLGIETTARAILRFMHALPLPPVVDPQIIGIDEWAWKRRQRYGAIVVDLELKAQGYRGSMRSVYRRLAKWRDHPRKQGWPASAGSVPRSPFEDVTPGQVIGWMLARPGMLSLQRCSQRLSPERTRYEYSLSSPPPAGCAGGDTSGGW